MSEINKRLIKTLEESDYEFKIKELLKKLLFIELRNYNNNYPRYGEDYERIIIDLIDKKEKKIK